MIGARTVIGAFAAIGALVLAGPAIGCRAAIPSPDAVATGRCLGPYCLGMPRAEALAAAGAPAQAVAGMPAGTAACLRFTGADLSLFGGDRITGVLVTSIPHCAEPDSGATPDVASGAAPVDVADCRGVRLGDPEAFVGKMHRQAHPVEPADDPWPHAPAGVRGLGDTCGPAASGTPRTTLYLLDERVVGIAIGGRP